MYEIRNSTAHSGELDPIEAKNGKSREKLAAGLWDMEHHPLLHVIGSMMKHIISYEINKA